jgi:hypothetical protein
MGVIYNYSFVHFKIGESDKLMSTTLKLSHLYVCAISIMGVLLFITHLTYEMTNLTQWVLIYALTGAVLLLNHFIIYLLPSGNALSMDSSIYLACIFMFGIDIPLLVLLLSSLITALIRYKTSWWKHVFNFAMYSLMIISSFYTFTNSGGVVGSTEISNLIPYALALSAYFLLNVIVVWVFFFLSAPMPLFKAIKEIINKGIIKESIMSYLSTLMLSLVLSILMSVQLFLGLFLFTLLTVLLSFAYTKFFNLYKGLEEKASRDFLTGLYNHGYFKLRLDAFLLTGEDETEKFSVA